MLSACGLAERSPNPTASATSGQPAPPDCPATDVTLSELIALGRGVAGPDCFGDSLLTLRGWVWEDRAAYDCVADWAVPGDPLPPDWLYCAATHHSRLTPVSYPPGEPLPGFIRPGDGPFFFAVDPASPAAEVVRPNLWVKVVGRRLRGSGGQLVIGPGAAKMAPVACDERTPRWPLPRLRLGPDSPLPARRTLWRAATYLPLTAPPPRHVAVRHTRRL